jgi:hypothetical protein
MLGWLRKQAEEFGAQVNPFDGGKTAETVRAQRRQAPSPVPTRSAPRQQQPSYGSGVGGFINRTRDVFDANTPQDQFRRQQQQELWKAPMVAVAPPDTRNLLERTFDQVNILDNNRTLEQAAPTNQKSAFQQGGQFTGQLARSSAGGLAKMANTVAAQEAQRYATQRMIAANLTNNPTAFRNASQFADAANQNFTENEGGLLNTGTVYSADDAKKGEFITGAKKIGGNTAQAMEEAYSLGTGVPVGAAIKKFGIREGLRQTAPALGKTFLANTAQGGTTTANQGGTRNDILKSAALSGLLGTAGDVGLGIGGATITKAVKGLPTSRLVTNQSGGIPIRNMDGADINGFRINNPDGARVTGLDINNPGNAQIRPLRINNPEGAVTTPLRGAALQSNLGKQPTTRLVDRIAAPFRDERGSVPFSMGGKQMTSALDAQAYKDFDGFYKDYKPFFDDSNLNVADARAVYDKAIREPATPTGTRGTRISSSAQTQFEQAYNVGDMTTARQFAQQIQDPTARNVALQAVDRSAPSTPTTQVTNPSVRAMIEAAQARKQQVKQPTTRLVDRVTAPFRDERGAIGRNIRDESQSPSKLETPSDLQRGFIKTVLEDPNTSPKVKESVSSLYRARNTKELQTKAATFVKEQPDLSEQMAKNAKDDTSIAIAMELVKKHQNAGDYTRAIDLVESVSKDLTEAGRTVQAASIYGKLTPEGVLRFTQKELNRYNKATGKEIKLTPAKADKLKQMADDLQKMPEGYDKEVAVQKMIAEIQKTMPTTLAEKVSTLQTMAQLLNPKTIIRNEVGNTAFLGLENVSQTIATPVDTLLGLFTKKRTTTLPNLKSQVGGLKEGRIRGVKESYQGINTGASTQYDLNSVPVFRGKVLGSLEKTMGAALRGGDRANYTAAFDDSLKGAMKLAKTKKATPDMLEAAHHAGLYRTFQDKNVVSNFFVGMKKTLNKVGFGIEGKRWGLGDLVLKYPKTPANLLARGIDYSPAGFVKTVFEASKPLFGKGFNQKAFVDSFSRATTGTAGLVGTGMALGALGIITESPEKDKDLRDLQKESGLGGYQINVSALKRFVASGFNKDAANLRENDTLISYDWAQPAAIPLSMGAAIGKGKNAKEGAGKSVNSLTEGINTITEQPMVRGLQQFFGSNKGALDVGIDVLKDAPASFIPTASNQVRQLTDNTNRNTYDPNPVKESLNRVANRVPWLANTVNPRVGSLGDNRKNYQNDTNNPLNVFFNPAFVNKYQPKDSARLPLDINDRTGETKQAPRSITTNQTVNGKSIKITAQQNEDLQRFVGEATDEAFTQLSQNPAFMKLSDEDKAKKMSSLITDINKAGKVQILGDEGFGTDAYKSSSLDKGVKAALRGDYSVTTSTKNSYGTFKEQYESALSEFNDPNNGYSPVEKVKKQKEIRKLAIKKDYDEDVVSLHSMTKADMYDYVSKAKNGGDLEKKLIAYDNALYEAGLSQYRKYKNGLAPASRGNSGSRSGRSSGRKSAGRKGGRGSRGGSRSAKGKFDYKLDAFAPKGGNLSKQLAKLVENAGKKSKPKIKKTKNYA